MCHEFRIRRTNSYYMQILSQDRDYSHPPARTRGYAAVRHRITIVVCADPVLLAKKRALLVAACSLSRLLNTRDNERDAQSGAFVVGPPIVS